ncbi:methyl-accepting chemotaxis protein [Desulfonatronum lacustre]|uniref:methyl-accepting chemotaxis protein n=1 Tax=Desulfonatronum lacustre TaxID=66849 RepID=UPI00048A643B|nr:methyl-accepting chemotaxis protein [Desulfonatronum lacustre]
MQLNLKTKMICFTLAVSIIPMAVVGWYGTYKGAEAVSTSVFQQLESVRDVKKHALEGLIQRWFGDLNMLQSDDAAGRALDEFADHAAASGVRPGARMDIQARRYKSLHQEFLPDLEGYVTVQGYYDVFVIGGDGRILFTQAEEPDLGEDLSKGVLANSGLAKAWAGAMQGGQVFIDFSPYSPSNGEPAAFIAGPIHQGGRVAGVVALQVSLGEVNALTTLRSGMGRTGETYLVGQDKLMRSDSYLDPVNHTVKASFADPIKGKVDTEPVRKALAGATGVGIFLDYNDNPVLSAYTRISIGDTHWALLAEIDEAEAFAPITALRVAAMIMGTIMLVLVVVSTLVILRRELLQPFASLQSFAGEVAAGNLDAEAEGNFKAELGQLKESVSTMVSNLKIKISEADAKAREAAEQMEKARAASEAAEAAKRQAEQSNEDILQAAATVERVVERMTTASEQLAAQVEQSSRGAEEQKNRTGETATAMEEMNATVLEVAKNASSAAEGSDKARVKAQDGAGVVSQAVAAINVVEQKTQAMKGDLNKLGQQAEQIGRIMTVIEDIADQTNLLALNAAIEAARAGDAGRGFAVVADEVRKLAEKTMNATKEVGDAIMAIQEGTKGSLRGMEQAVEAVGEATKLANVSGQSLQEIVTLVEEAADQVRSIATAAEEQSSASEEINRSVEDINRISMETSDVMDQSAQAVSELARQAVELRTLVQQLKQD